MQVFNYLFTLAGYNNARVVLLIKIQKSGVNRI